VVENNCLAKPKRQKDVGKVFYVTSASVTLTSRSRRCYAGRQNVWPV